MSCILVKYVVVAPVPFVPANTKLSFNSSAASAPVFSARVTVLTPVPKLIAPTSLLLLGDGVSPTKSFSEQLTYAAIANAAMNRVFFIFFTFLNY